nr:oplophorus-luciferin 2-monooxygenase non-catalytic subunit-like [Procambarus clarkii]
MAILSPGVRGLVCVLMMVAICPPRPALLHTLHQEESAPSFPCPESTAIHPCLCLYDSPSGTLNLTCSNLASYEQLDNIFAADFPFTKFNWFQLQNSNVTSLKKGLFRDVYFSRMVLIFNNITLIEEGTLETMYNSLEYFHISEIYDGDYQWPLPDLAKFTSLIEIGINGPYETLPVLESSSLTSVFLGMRKLVSLPDNLFTSTPNLQFITFQETNVNSIQGNTFKLLSSLKKIEITRSGLASLTEASLAFGSPDMEYINIISNPIETIEAGAFQGLSGSVTVNVSHNLLEQLTENVFSELLKNTTETIDVSNNPLLCGCDLYWLINITDADLNRLKGLLPSCAIENGVYDRDTLVDFMKYQCS